MGVAVDWGVPSYPYLGRIAVASDCVEKWDSSRAEAEPFPSALEAKGKNIHPGKDLLEHRTGSSCTVMVAVVHIDELRVRTSPSLPLDWAEPKVGHTSDMVDLGVFVF